MFRSLILSLAIAGVTAPAFAQSVQSDPPTVILVHGAFADASSWDGVAQRLRQHGVPVVAVENPLTSLKADVQVTRDAIAAAPGKVVLVGHSWGGTVITEAGTDAKVAALVYVAAFAPDAGQNSAQQGDGYPVGPGLQHLQERDGWLSLSAQTFAEDFAPDLSPGAQAEAQAHQKQLKASALSESVEAVAWRSRPSWYVAARQDRMLVPQLQIATAHKIGAALREIDASHAVAASHPDAVGDIILEAAGLPHQSTPQD